MNSPSHSKKQQIAPEENTQEKHNEASNQLIEQQKQQFTTLKKDCLDLMNGKVHQMDSLLNDQLTELQMSIQKKIDAKIEYIYNNFESLPKHEKQFFAQKLRER